MVKSLLQGKYLGAKIETGLLGFVIRVWKKNVVLLFWASKCPLFILSPSYAIVLYLHLLNTTILGAKRRNNNLFYLIKFGDVKNVEEQPHSIQHFMPTITRIQLKMLASTRMPEAVLCTYLSKLAVFRYSNNQIIWYCSCYMHWKKTDLSYYIIIDATDTNGDLLLWMQWKSEDPGVPGPCKFVTAIEANKKWPKIVIRFYESNIDFN